MQGAEHALQNWALRQPTANSSTANSSKGHEFEREFDRGFVSQSVAVSQPEWAGGEPSRRPVRRGSECQACRKHGRGGSRRSSARYRVARRSAGWCDRRAASRPVRLGAGEARPSEDRPPDGFGCGFDNMGGISQPLGRARFRVAGQRASAATLRLDGRRGGCRCASSHHRLNLL